MRIQLTRRQALLVGGSILVVILSALTRIMAPGVAPSIARVLHQPSSIGAILRDCTHDPSNVAPPPAGPDGRPTNYLHTCGARILDNQGREVRITGVNWSGMENSGDAPGGLGNRNWHDILDQVAGLGYNTIRIPFSNEAIDSKQSVGNVDFGLNPDLQGLTGLQLLDRLVDGARQRGLKVILDRHQPTSAGRTTLWYSTEVSEEHWLADWRMLAARYRGNDTVIGVDLHNEPHGNATWGTDEPATDWRLAAERAGNVVEDANPYVLVFVEGIENVGSDHFWWGGNLSAVSWAPVRLRVSNRVVYSPHDYGPAISSQPWFTDSRFPSNLAGEWDRHWGYIAHDQIAPVVIGEFGGLSFGTDPDGQWQTSLLAYIQANHLGALVWSLNPSWDTGGLLGGDWTTVNQVKQQAYRSILAPPIDAGPTGTFGRSQSRPTVMLRPNPGGSPSDWSVTLTVINDGPTPIDLGRVELRYWLPTGPAVQSAIPKIESTDGVQSSSVTLTTSSSRGRAFTSLMFAPGSAIAAAYRAGGSVTLRFQVHDGQAASPLSESSTAGGATPPSDLTGEIGFVTTYLDGHLAWGQEPAS